MKAIDITGIKFSRLAPIRYIRTCPKTKNRIWLCRCDCGNEIEARAASLRSGNTKSCGCLDVEKATARVFIHGMGRKGKESPEFIAYLNAKQRCTNRNLPQWCDYGGRGIHFLFASFQEFYTELGPRPSDMVLDRINNDGHYEPGNVRWVTRSQSSLNRRKYTHKRK